MSAVWRDGAYLNADDSGETITIPSDCQAGDRAVLGVLVMDANATITAPGGWDPLGSQQADGGTGTGGDVAALFTRELTVDDPGAEVTIAYSGASGIQCCGLLGVWAGASSATPAAAPSLDTRTGTTHPGPGLTAAQDGTTMAVILLERAAKQSASYSTSGGTGSPTVAIRQPGIAPGVGVPTADGFITDAGGAGAGVVSGDWSMISNQQSFGKAFTFAVAIAPAATSQAVTLASDVTVTGWTKVGAAATFAGVLADSDDATYGQSQAGPDGQVLEVLLEDDAAAALASVTVRARYAAGATSGTLVTSLVQGTTVVAGPWTDDLTGDFTDYTHATTSGEQAAQTDLADLRIRVALTAA